MHSIDRAYCCTNNNQNLPALERCSPCYGKGFSENSDSRSAYWQTKSRVLYEKRQEKNSSICSRLPKHFFSSIPEPFPKGPLNFQSIKILLKLSTVSKQNLGGNIKEMNTNKLSTHVFARYLRISVCHTKWDYWACKQSGHIPSLERTWRTFIGKKSALFPLAAKSRKSFYSVRINNVMLWVHCYHDRYTKNS